MKNFVAVLVLIGAAGCTALDRRIVSDTLGGYVQAKEYPDGTFDKDAQGAPIFDGYPDFDPAEVAGKAATELAKRGGDPYGLAAYVGVGLVTLGVGYIKRRFLAKQVRALIGRPKPAATVEEILGDQNARSV